MLLLLLLSCIFYGATAQQSASNIEKVSSLITTSNSYWSSDSGHFAFGFYQQGDGFALGIWMPRIQQKTVIWTANLNDPPLPTRLTWHQGHHKLVSNANQSASSASMLDSGNFVLYDSESKIIRQTFASPTDNIVSEQRLLAGQKLVSSTSNINQSSGGFELNMQTDGNLVMYPAVLFARVAAYAYWSTATYTAGNNVSLNLDSNGQLYLLNSTGFTIKTLKERATISGNPIYRGTIDEDGIFRLYLHNLDQNSNWSVEWSSSSKCDPINLCGLNSYCTLVDQDSACICLPGFEFVDQGQENLGCKRNSTLDDCISFRESNVTMQELTSISWEDDPYYILESSTSIACRDERLGDCYCEAAIYSKRQCRKKKLPLRFGVLRSSNPGHFAFGFYREGNGFAVGIWFANIQQRTVIWTANRDDTPLPSDVTLTLSTDGRLVLQFNQGQEIPISDATLYASSASMLDSVNLVLYDSESRIICQTFDAPTDTIISGQRLLAGKQLVASISNTNHSSGRFELIMQTDVNLVMYPSQSPRAVAYAYWSTATFAAGNNLMDGIFRLYSHNLDQNGNWSIEWSSSDNLCDPIVLCGLNSYCTLADRVPTCVCTAGFDFIDQSQKNLGCKKNSSSIDCMSLAETISCALVHGYRAWAYKAISTEANRERVWDVSLRSFTYQELERATDGFREKLGRGAFGTAFKGT
ncbi:hypothetical protein RCOM_1170110 [Ricinus communis]|uniref:Bulb-type lectin domain-containing protein n=1 Tax=Ricinus communis TaxID=3988 RepID=B9T440_RICCO|nr:hypothetical protein RCOM_1170110 [Ricinus communis]